jgi:hypothetical protein
MKKWGQIFTSPFEWKNKSVTFFIFFHGGLFLPVATLGSNLQRSTDHGYRGFGSSD